MTQVNFSDATIDILKNFANINPQVILKEGTAQRVCNESRNFVADVEFAESIPVDCAFYDINRILGIIDNCKGSTLPTFTFGENNLVLKHDDGTVTLPYAHPGVVEAPPANKYHMAKLSASFDLPAALWNKIKRTASVLQTTSLQFTIEDDKLSVKLINERAAGGDTVGWGTFNMPNTIVAPGAPNKSWLIKFDALEFLPGDYFVELGDIASSVNATTSTFGVFFKLNDPAKKVTYITAGHVVKGKTA